MYVSTIRNVYIWHSYSNHSINMAPDNLHSHLCFYTFHYEIPHIGDIRQ